MFLPIRAPSVNIWTIWERRWKLYTKALQLGNFGRNTHLSVLPFPFHQMLPLISTCSLWWVCQSFPNKQTKTLQKQIIVPGIEAALASCPYLGNFASSVTDSLSSSGASSRTLPSGIFLIPSYQALSDQQCALVLTCPSAQTWFHFSNSTGTHPSSTIWPSQVLAHQLCPQTAAI